MEDIVEKISEEITSKDQSFCNRNVPLVIYNAEEEEQEELLLP